MALTPEQIQEVTAMMEQYIAEHRPEEAIRPQLDLGWRLEGQSVYLFEIRPQWNDASIILHHDFAKATWVQSQKQWKIYWQRANLKWELYPPLPSVGNLQRFLIEVEKDPYGCFLG